MPSQITAWWRENKYLHWPVAIWFVYALGGLILLGGLLTVGVGNEKTTTHKPDGTLEVVDKQTPSLLVALTTVAAGGWLIIPLKFAWDELTKHNEDRRAVAARMRDLVFTRTDAYFGPLLYRYRRVETWTNRAIDPATDVAAFKRLLYSISLMYQQSARITDDGVVLLLRTLDTERSAVESMQNLSSFLIGFFGAGVEPALVQSVAVDKSVARPFATYLEFAERLDAAPDTSPLVGAHSRLLTNLPIGLTRYALLFYVRAAESKLRGGLNDVYREWYEKN